MFGEYVLYCEGKVVALVCSDALFLKPTPSARARLGREPAHAPYPGAKPHLLVPGEDWDDADELAALVKAVATELPEPRGR